MVLMVVVVKMVMVVLEVGDRGEGDDGVRVVVGDRGKGEGSGGVCCGGGFAKWRR